MQPANLHAHVTTPESFTVTRCFMKSLKHPKTIVQNNKFETEINSIQLGVAASRIIKEERQISKSRPRQANWVYCCSVETEKEKGVLVFYTEDERPEFLRSQNIRIIYDDVTEQRVLKKALSDEIEDSDLPVIDPWLFRIY